MEDFEISTDETVAELLSQWPEVIPVFLRHHMGCVGCVMSRFQNLRDVSTIYELDINIFLEEIRQAVRSADRSNRWG